jgi:hypothetical protein
MVGNLPPPVVMEMPVGVGGEGDVAMPEEIHHILEGEPARVSAGVRDEAGDPATAHP